MMQIGSIHSHRPQLKLVRNSTLNLQPSSGGCKQVRRTDGLKPPPPATIIKRMITSPATIVRFVPVGQQIRSCMMENHSPAAKVYFHYNHTDSRKYFRWNARESYQFMYERPWQQVLDFYSDVVKGKLSISSLIGTEAHVDHKDAQIVESFDETETLSDLKKDKTGRWARVTYKIVLSYHGVSFDGWQKQPDLNTVQGLVETSLGGFVDERKAKLLKDKGSPIEGAALVAGRTDKGVTALRQVCSFYTWRTDVSTQEIKDAINSAAPGRLRVISVSKVSRAFHPNFCAKWRRYLYLFPLNDEEEGMESSESEINAENIDLEGNLKEDRTERAEYLCEEDSQNLINDENCESETGMKPRRFSVSRVDQLLRQLEGKLLSYRMFARDTKASRNVGPPTECFIYHARATEAILPRPLKENEEVAKVMCVELVANRFLRRMVRVLVATSIREAAAGAEDDALLKLMDATCRRATAPPAPPDGLCLVNVGYTEFDPQSCLIP